MDYLAWGHRSEHLLLEVQRDIFLVFLTKYLLVLLIGPIGFLIQGYTARKCLENAIL